MSALPYYPRFPRDFLDGTAALSFEEKGAYAIIIDLIFMRDGRLEDEPRYIAGHLNCSVRKWKSIRSALLEKGKIQVIDGIISTVRSNYLLEKQRKYQGKQAENASKPNKNNGVQKPTHKPKASHPDLDIDTERDTSEANASSASLARDADEPAVDWKVRLAEAFEAAGEALDTTSPAVHVARDLRRLTEPTTGEPCSWDEVLDAIRTVAASARQRGRKLRSWQWVAEPALGFRDRRLAGLPPPAAVIPFAATGPPGESVTSRALAILAEEDKQRERSGDQRRDSGSGHALSEASAH